MLLETRPRRLLAALVLLAAAGCATTREEQSRCDVRHDRRPFGRRFERFGEIAAAFPGEVADDTSSHLGHLGATL